MDIGYCEAKKGYCKAKWLKIFPLVQKKKFKKYRKNNYRSTLELFCAKNGSDGKTPNIRKMTIFSKWPNLATMQRL